MMTSQKLVMDFNSSLRAKQSNPGAGAPTSAVLRRPSGASRNDEQRRFPPDGSAADALRLGPCGGALEFRRRGFALAGRFGALGAVFQNDVADSGIGRRHGVE